MKYYLIAGEASGDLHGSNLMAGLIQQDKNTEFRFWGGDLMAKHGGEPVKHYRDLAFMGIVKVILNLPTILKNLKFCQQDILNFQPDVVILIDYAGFNLKVAKFTKLKGIKTFYYIAPKIWAWKTGRIKTIKKYVDRVFTILPFETEFYQKYNYNVDYVGNPVNDAIASRPDVDELRETFLQRNHLPDKPIIGLLAGSRKQEINFMLPVMLEVSKYFPNYQFVVAGAPGIYPELYQSIIGKLDVPVIYNETYKILQHSEAALVTSGTATLETALMNVPQIVCYKSIAGNFLYRIGRMLLKVPYISLVNLILNYEAVKEMVQMTFKKEYLEKELDVILSNQNYKNQILNSYAELREKIGTPGASLKAAELIYKALT